MGRIDNDTYQIIFFTVPLLYKHYYSILICHGNITLEVSCVTLGVAVSNFYLKEAFIFTSIKLIQHKQHQVEYRFMVTTVMTPARIHPVVTIPLMKGYSALRHRSINDVVSTRLHHSSPLSMLSTFLLPSLL